MKEIKVTRSNFQEKNEDEREAVSPLGQYFNSESLSISVIAVLESDTPIFMDDSDMFSWLEDVLLPINPRFSSIMVKEKNGDKKWKKVKVNLKQHLKVPVLPVKMGLEFCDKCFDDYLSKMSVEQFSENKPLWEVHMFKYETSKSPGTFVFKFHHSLGDGYSLMGVLLSCLQRAENPSIPLKFPSRRSSSNNIIDVKEHGYSYGTRAIVKCVTNVFHWTFAVVSDICSSLINLNTWEDDVTPLRSGRAGFHPTIISTIDFPFCHIKLIKDNHGVTINDVIMGMVFLGSRLYMQGTKATVSSISNALVLVNTRMLKDFKSVEEMVKQNTESPWGNHFGFLHVPIPNQTELQISNPIEAVKIAHEMIKKKKTSLGVYLNGWFLDAVRKIRGPEEAAKYVYKTLKNSTMAITNMKGPVEKVALADHPIKGLYFMVVGAPQSIIITIMSYEGKLRIGVGTEKDFIDNNRFKICLQTAFDSILKAPSAS